VRRRLASTGDPSEWPSFSTAKQLGCPSKLATPRKWARCAPAGRLRERLTNLTARNVDLPWRAAQNEKPRRDAEDAVALKATARSAPAQVWNVVPRAAEDIVHGRECSASEPDDDCLLDRCQDRALRFRLSASAVSAVAATRLLWSSPTARITTARALKVCSRDLRQGGR
jgi:hypothetical protein